MTDTMTLLFLAGNALVLGVNITLMILNVRTSNQLAKGETAREASLLRRLDHIQEKTEAVYDRSLQAVNAAYQFTAAQASNMINELTASRLNATVVSPGSHLEDDYHQIIRKTPPRAEEGLEEGPSGYAPKREDVYSFKGLAEMENSDRDDLKAFSN